MKILLTGITGFIGSNLAKKIIAEGYRLEAIVRQTSKIDELPLEVQHNCKFWIINKDGSLVDILKESQPNIVCHLASLYLAKHDYDDISHLVDSNITFGTELLDAMVENKIFNFINTGTAWQHYNNANYSPVNLYAATKQAFADIIKYYEEAKGLKVIDLQLFDTYGEGDKRKKILVLFKEYAGTDKVLNMSPGEQKIDLVHIDDVTSAYMLAIKYLYAGDYAKCGTYAVTTGNSLSLRQLARKYEKINNTQLNINFGALPYREREVMQPWNNGRLLPDWHRKHDELM